MHEFKQQFDLVIFNMSSWYEWVKKDIPNRNRHILFELKKREEIGKILAIDFMPYTLKRGIKIFLENNFLDLSGYLLDRSFSYKFVQREKDLYTFTQIDTIIPATEEIVLQRISKFIKKLDFKNVILWSYFPMFCEYFKSSFEGKFNEKIRVFDAVDDWSCHPNFKKYRNRLEKNYKVIDLRCDLIFTVSQGLLNKFSHNENKYWIPNAVDFEHFQKVTDKPPEDIKRIKKPIIGYAGVIQERVDFDLVRYLAKKNPQISFVFVGPIWTKKLFKRPNKEHMKISKVKDLTNVYFLGQKTYNQVPAYIHQFDLGIIPHRINQFTESMNPLKMYEYLACGKPIVSTNIAGLESLKGFIKIGKTFQEFDQEIKKSLKENNRQLKEKRIEEAKKNSWEKRVDEMLQLIFKKTSQYNT